MTTMAKLPADTVFHNISLSIFPQPVLDAIEALQEANRLAGELREKADKMLQPYAPRIAVAGSRVVHDGDSLGWTLRYQKDGMIRVWSDPTTAKARPAAGAATLIAAPGTKPVRRSA
jgi:hypothetical protein